MRPKPYRWIFTKDGVVEAYDFTSLTKSNPPPDNHETEIIQFPLGYMRNGCWLSR